MIATNIIPTRANWHLYAWIGLLAVAVASYALGLGGQYIPTNGDELVYAHIARITANTGHWLPLASELDHMRNTKPPLLFWQAMVAGGWGSHWTLFWLRLPSLIYTLLTTGAVAWSVWLLSRQPARAIMAACIYLAFFSSFRYGRPYLTSAAETFWLDLPMFALLWSQARQIRDEKVPLALVRNRESAITFVVIAIATGLAWGIGSLYKSFALIVPAAAAMGAALLCVRADWRAGALFKTALQVGASAAIGLAIFALWFVMDPDPAAVWKEFVVGENVGKMGDKVGYWHEALLGGGSSLWAELLSYVENAGLLAFVVIGMAASTWQQGAQRRGTPLARLRSLPPHAWILLAWLVVWLLVFALPSQRSARYVIPAMPALAIVLTLIWDRIARGWFVASLALVGIVTLALARISWVMHDLGISTAAEFATTFLAILAVAVLVTAGMFKTDLTRACSVAASLLFYTCFTLTTAPLDGPAGRYANGLGTALKGKSVAVPSNFNAQYERFEFLLAGGRFVPFDMALITVETTSATHLTEYLARHDAVVWGPSTSDQVQAPCLPQCHVIATRWVVKERHKSGDITWGNLWHPHAWLFSREWLLTLNGELAAKTGALPRE